MIGNIKLHGCDILACIILNFSMSLLMLEYVWMALNNNLYRMQGNNFSRLCFVLMIWYCFFLRLYDNKLFYFQFVLFALHFNGTKLFKQCLEGGSWTCIPTPIPRLSRIPFSFSMPHPVPFLSRNFGFFPETNPHCISIKSGISRVPGSFSCPPPPTLSVAGARKDGIREKIKPISSLVEGPEVVVLFLLVQKQYKWHSPVLIGCGLVVIKKGKKTTFFCPYVNKIMVEFYWSKAEQVQFRSLNFMF